MPDEKNFPLTNADLLYAQEMGIIDAASVFRQIEMSRRKEILNKHGSCIWYGEKYDAWFCHLPDSTKKSGRRQVTRRTREEIENVVYEYYLGMEERGSVEANKEATLAELYDEFIEYKKSCVAMTTVKRLEADWKRYYEPKKEFSGMPFRQIKGKDIDVFLNRMITENELTTKRFRNICGVLNQLLKYALDSDYIDRNPYRVNVNKKLLMPDVKKDNSTQVYLPEEMDMLIKELEEQFRKNPASTVPLAILLDFEIGVRKAELLAIKISGIDFEKRMLHITQQVVERIDPETLCSEGFEITNHTKSYRGNRYIPLTERAMRLIRLADSVNFDNGYEGDLLFNRNGNVISPDALDYCLRWACSHLKIPYRSMHKIRKTYASRLYKSDVPVPVISKMLGHAEESTTLRHYIYNMLDDDGSNEVVLEALEGPRPDPCPARPSQKVIPFPVTKKARKTQ